MSEILIGSTKIDVPEQKMIFRKRNMPVYEKFIELGESNLSSIIASNRINDISSKAYNDLVMPSMKNMPFWKLKDIDVAAKRIAEAYVNNEVIGLVTDFDVDGICSAVVMKSALVEYMGFPEKNIQTHVNNRMLYGYGFNEKALNAVMERSEGVFPTLIITADQGSNDTATIKTYKEIMESHGVDNSAVIVTDHHHVKKGEVCEDAIAFINPQRPDDEFDDSTICGCVVALLVMAAAREYMIHEEILPGNTPALTPLLTYATLATVADCVSLKSGYNRCIIRRGLKDINKGLIPAWRVLKRKIKKDGGLVTVEDMGFRMGPAINADSRTGGDGTDAVNFLMSKTDDEAIYYLEKLNVKNNTRKEIDLAMQEAAMKDASIQYYEKGRRGLSVFLPSGSHGIHGIVASRVKERFNCPIIIFSPVDLKDKDKKNPERMITGSGRCIDEFSIIKIVQDIIADEVDIPTSGGHQAAMGLKIKLGDFEKFRDLFDKAVKSESVELNVPDSVFSPIVKIDHLFQGEQLKQLNSTDILKEINHLEPYGQRFEAPVFALNGVVTNTKTFGSGINENAHIEVSLKDSSNMTRRAVVFNYSRQPWIEELAIGEQYTFAFTLMYDSFRKSVGMMIISLSPGVNSIDKP